MTAFILGILIAFVGALLLATGSELQSQAVHRADGTWRVLLRSPGWLLGLVLLAVPVAASPLVLALAPVSAVQAVSVAALAASAAFGGITGRIVMNRSVALAIIPCIVGTLGFITVLATHPGAAEPDALDARLAVVITILAALTFGGAIVALTGSHRAGRGRALAGLVLGSMTFGSITTVVKVLVGLTLRDGLTATLTTSLPLIALILIVIGGGVAYILLQRSHRTYPAPAVVAGLTVIDPLTAAVIGIIVLGEAALTPGGVALLVLFGAVATAGVLGLSRLRRITDQPAPHPSPTADTHRSI